MMLVDCSFEPDLVQDLCHEECREVVDKSHAGELQVGFLACPPYGKTGAGRWRGEYVRNLRLGKAVTADVHVEVLLYLLYVAAYFLTIDDAKHSLLAMTQVEVYVGEVSEYGFRMTDV